MLPMALLIMSFAHKFYVSLTQIDHNATTNSLEVSVRLFTDDLEKAIEEQTGKRLYLDTEKELPEAEDAILSYVRQRLHLIVNGKMALVNEVGRDYEREHTWAYIEVQNVSELKTLEVRNVLLCEVFEEQTNMVKVRANNNELRSANCSKDSPAIAFAF